MASPPLLSFALFSLLFLFSSGSANPTIIHEACKASRDILACESSLSSSTHVPEPATIPQIIGSALAVSSENLETGRVMVQKVLDSFAGDPNGTTAAKTCLTLLRYSKLRLRFSGRAMTRGDIKDARAWTSAALAYQYDCWSALKHVNKTPLVANTMSFLNNSLIGSTSNDLGMLVNFDVFGEETGLWGPPKTERDGFWEPIRSGSKFSGGVPTGLKPDVTVCKGGGCSYTTVQEAVNAAPNSTGPGQRFVIRIKAGVYEEIVRVPWKKKNVVFLGDGMGKTVITGSRSVGLQPGMSTFNSATVGVIGDGFMASNLTIKNTAGPNAHQAVAFRSDSDLSVLDNCEFIGNQDTLYVHSLRQYYKSCRVIGNIDFIFGNAAAFFQDCLILIAPRNVRGGENNVIAAHGRTDPALSTGFVFHSCHVNGTHDYMASHYRNPEAYKNYLGRPWKAYSRTVFIECKLEALISPDGWMPWDGDFALKTLYYGEFGNVGSGSDTSKRVWWSSRIPSERVKWYSVENFIQGDRWIPRLSVSVS